MRDDEERSAAEDYRRQRQRADAQRHGYKPHTDEEFAQWMNERADLLMRIAKANGASEHDVPALLDEYKKTLWEAPAGSEFDEKNAQLILQRIIADIEDVCRAGRIPIRSGVVYGVAPEGGLVASQRAVLATELSILSFSLSFITFCNLISKAMARTLIHEPGELTRVNYDPEKIRTRLHSSKELVAEWSSILLHYAAFGAPPPRLTPAPEPIALKTRILILEAIEWFSVAHEYGHHVMMHGIADSSDAEGNPFDQEHDADKFATMVSVALGFRKEEANQFAASSTGGVIILGMLDLVRRARAVLTTGSDDSAPRETHPPYSERVAIIASMDEYLAEEYRQFADDIRTAFTKIIESIWEEVRPVVRDFYEGGLRPHENAQDVGGWLPL